MAGEIERPVPSNIQAPGLLDEVWEPCADRHKKQWAPETAVIGAHYSNCLNNRSCLDLAAVLVIGWKFPQSCVYCDACSQQKCHSPCWPEFSIASHPSLLLDLSRCSPSGPVLFCTLV